ncbi:MAG: radical SAM protein, partial [Candidatus Omnitrophica bacterium]|nr:radical SAM protein [Candidatus Omnitrophota bacterium]
FEDPTQLIKVLNLEQAIKSHTGVSLGEFTGHISLGYPYGQPNQGRWDDLLGSLEHYENMQWGEFVFKEIDFASFSDMNNFSTILTKDLISGRISGLAASSPLDAHIQDARLISMADNYFGGNRERTLAALQQWQNDFRDKLNKEVAIERLLNIKIDENQENATEYFRLLNPDGSYTGKIKPRHLVHRDGDWHGSTYVMVFDGEGDLILQRRSNNRQTDPGKLEGSVSGHMGLEMDGRETACREAKEELGLIINPADLILIGGEKQYVDVFDTIDIDGNEVHNRGLNSLYVYVLPKGMSAKDLRFNPEEVSGLETRPLAEEVRRLEEQPGDYASVKIFLQKDSAVVKEMATAVRSHILARDYFGGDSRKFNSALKQWQSEYQTLLKQDISIAELLNKEFFLVTDKEGNYITDISGNYSIRPRDLCHFDGTWHRCVFILLADWQGNVLMQTRSASKEYWPLAKDIVGGHHGLDIEPILAAQRETNEEIFNDEYKIDPVRLFQMNKDASLIHACSNQARPEDNERVTVFIYITEDKEKEIVKYDPKEVLAEGCNWSDLDTEIEELRAHPENYAPAVTRIFEIDKAGTLMHPELVTRIRQAISLIKAGDLEGAKALDIRSSVSSPLGALMRTYTETDYSSSPIAILTGASSPVELRLFKDEEMLHQVIPASQPEVKVVRQGDNMSLLYNTADINDIPARVLLINNPIIALPEIPARAWQLMDGKRSLLQIYETLNQEYPQKADLDFLVYVFAQLDRLGYLRGIPADLPEAVKGSYPQESWDLNVAKIQYSSQFTEIPLYVLLEITYACSRKPFCKTCYMPFTKGMERDLGDNEFLEGVVQPIIDSGAAYVTILGGEPLLRQELLYEALKRLKENRIYTKVISNGDLFTEYVVRQLEEARLNKLEISIDGFNESINDEIRGAYSFANIKRTMELLNKSHIPEVGISVTVSSWNFAEVINDLSGFLRLYPKITKVYFSRFFKHNRCAYGAEEITLEQIEQLKIAIAGWQREFQAERPRFEAVILDLGKCSCGRSMVVITPSGKIKPCPFFWGLGKSLAEEKDLLKLWKNSFFALRGMDNSICYTRLFRDIQKLNSLLKTPGNSSSPLGAVISTRTEQRLSSPVNQASEAAEAVRQIWNSISSEIKEFDPQVEDKTESFLARFYHANKATFESIIKKAADGPTDPFVQANITEPPLWKRLLLRLGLGRFIQPDADNDESLHESERVIKLAFLKIASNPLNDGHKRIAYEAIERLNLDAAIISVQGKISYKNLLRCEKVSVKERHLMTRMALANEYPLLRYTNLCRQRHNDEEGAVTIQRFLNMNKDRKMEVYYIIGAENEERMWKYIRQQYDAFKKYGFGSNPNHKIIFTVMQRGEYGKTVTTDELERISRCVQEEKNSLIHLPVVLIQGKDVDLNVSSTYYRNVQDGAFVPAFVHRFSQEKGYYGHPPISFWTRKPIVDSSQEYFEMRLYPVAKKMARQINSLIDRYIATGISNVVTIAIDGGSGSGKTTIANVLRKILKQQYGIDVSLARHGEKEEGAIGYDYVLKERNMRIAIAKKVKGEKLTSAEEALIRDLQIMPRAEYLEEESFFDRQIWLQNVLMPIKSFENSKEDSRIITLADAYIRGQKEREDVTIYLKKGTVVILEGKYVNEEEFQEFYHLRYRLFDSPDRTQARFEIRSRTLNPQDADVQVAFYKFGMVPSYYKVYNPRTKNAINGGFIDLRGESWYLTATTPANGDSSSPLTITESIQNAVVIENHGEIFDILKNIKMLYPQKDIAVLNFDAHTDMEKGKGINASWAWRATEQKIIRRVFHMESAWKSDKGINEPWQSSVNLKNIKDFIAEGDYIVVISIDLDYFSLSYEVLEEREWEDVYHRSPEEVKLMIDEIIKFVKESNILVYQVVVAESPRYLSTLATKEYVSMLIDKCDRLNQELGVKAIKYGYAQPGVNEEATSSPIENNNPEALSRKNLEEALIYIKESNKLGQPEKNELAYLLSGLYDNALYYFMLGAKDNPLYHNTQVLGNMVRIGLGEGLSYSELKKALVLALLHDIGNAVSEKEKVKNSQIEEALNAGKIDEAKLLAQMSTEFRLEHMEKGPELVRLVTNQFVREGILKSNGVDLICEAVKVHDYPSIEKANESLRKLGAEVKYAKGYFLFQFEDYLLGRLITLLREADRLFMVSYQGVIKDLLDDKKEITPENIRGKLESNLKSHAKEYQLYVKSGKDDGRFISQTLYRTRTGYGIYAQAKNEIEKKIKESFHQPRAADHKLGADRLSSPVRSLKHSSEFLGSLAGKHKKLGIILIGAGKYANEHLRAVRDFSKKNLCEPIAIVDFKIKPGDKSGAVSSANSPLPSIEIAAQVLAGQGANVVFEKNSRLSRWLFRRGGIEVVMPQLIIDILSMRMEGEGRDAVLFSLRNQSEQDIKEALYYVLELGKPIMESFPRHGIPAYFAFKKVLLVPPYGDSYGQPLKYNLPHYGIYTIEFLLIREVEDVDAYVYDPNLGTREELYDLVSQERFHIIGFSLLQINLKENVRIMGKVHLMSPSSFIVMGGYTISSFPMKELFSALPCDVYVRDDGTGLIEMVKIFSGLRDNLWHARLLQISNLIINTSDGPHQTSNKEIQRKLLDIRSDIPINRPDVTHNKSYNISGKGVSTATIIPLDRVGRNPLSISYGNFCRGKCIYCSIPRNTHKPPDSAEVIDIISQHINKHDSINFDCADFLSEYEQAWDLLTVLKRSPYAAIPKKATSCVNSIGDGNILQEMFLAGIRILAFGIESFSTYVLQRIGKHITREQNIRALELTLASGIRPGINLILFTPWDTIETTMDTIQQAIGFVEKGAYVNVVYRLTTNYGMPISAMEKLIEYEEYRFPGMKGALRVPTSAKIFDEKLNRLAARTFEIYKVLNIKYDISLANMVCIYGLLLFKAFYLAYGESEGYTEGLTQNIKRIDRAIENTVGQVENTSPDGCLADLRYGDYPHVAVPKTEQASSLRIQEYMASKFPAELFTAIIKHTDHIEIHRGPQSKTNQHIESLEKDGYKVSILGQDTLRIRNYYLIDKNGERLYVISNNIGNSRELFIVQVLHFYGYPEKQIQVRTFPFDIRHHLLERLGEYQGRISQVIIAHSINETVEPAILRLDDGARTIDTIRDDFLYAKVMRLSGGELALVCDIEYINGEQIKPILEFFADDIYLRGLAVKEILVCAACGSLNDSVAINDVIIPSEVYQYNKNKPLAFFNAIQPDELRVYMPQDTAIHNGTIFTIPTVLSSSTDLVRYYMSKSQRAAIELELAHAIEASSNYPNLRMYVLYETHDKPASGVLGNKEDTLGNDVPGLREMGKRKETMRAVLMYILHKWSLKESLLKDSLRAGVFIRQLPRNVFTLGGLVSEVSHMIDTARQKKGSSDILIGIGGMTGSGKSHYITPNLKSAFMRTYGEEAGIIAGDRFVMDKNQRPAGAAYPKSLFNFNMMLTMLRALRNKQAIAFPLYDHQQRRTPTLTADDISPIKDNKTMQVPYYTHPLILLGNPQEKIYGHLKINKDSLLGFDPQSAAIIEIIKPGKSIYIFEAAPALIFPELRDLYDISIFTWSSPKIREQHLIQAKLHSQRLLHYTFDEIKHRLECMQTEEDAATFNSITYADLVFINEKTPVGSLVAGLATKKLSRTSSPVRQSEVELSGFDFNKADIQVIPFRFCRDELTGVIKDIDEEFVLVWLSTMNYSALGI